MGTHKRFDPSAKVVWLNGRGLDMGVVYAYSSLPRYSKILWRIVLILSISAFNGDFTFSSNQFHDTEFVSFYRVIQELVVSIQQQHCFLSQLSTVA